LERVPSAHHDTQHLHAEDQAGSPKHWGLDYIRATRLSNRHASDIVVAVLDAVIDFRLPVFADNVWINPQYLEPTIPQRGKDRRIQDDLFGVDFTDPERPAHLAWPDEGDTFHGTNVAALIASPSQESSQVQGVAHSAKLMSLQVQPARLKHHVEAVVQAVHYAVLHGAHILNCSFSIPWGSRLLQRAFQFAQDQGVLIVAAAGNDDQDLALEPAYPAALPLDLLITVGAMDPEAPDQLADLSNFGPQVHLAAPGGGFPLLTHRQGECVEVAVTSYAAAMVSGAAALVWSQKIDRSKPRRRQAYEVREMLLRHSRCVTPSLSEGMEGDRLKTWGDQNRVLDLGFMV